MVRFCSFLSKNLLLLLFLTPNASLATFPPSSSVDIKAVKATIIRPDGSNRH